MACGCNKVVSTNTNYNTSKVTDKGLVVCNQDFNSLNNLRNILQAKYNSRDFTILKENELIYNLGLINTMLNLKDPCRYNLQHIINGFKN